MIIGWKTIISIALVLCSSFDAYSIQDFSASEYGRHYYNTHFSADASLIDYNPFMLCLLQVIPGKYLQASLLFTVICF